MNDLISRHAAIDAMMTILDKPNHAEFLYTDEICKVLNELPSAEPEIVRCKECKHYQGEDSWLHCNRVTWFNGKDDFCSRAERETNEADY